MSTRRPRPGHDDDGPSRPRLRRRPPPRPPRRGHDADHDDHDDSPPTTTTLPPTTTTAAPTTTTTTPATTTTVAHADHPGAHGATEHLPRRAEPLEVMQTNPDLTEFVQASFGQARPGWRPTVPHVTAPGNDRAADRARADPRAAPRRVLRGAALRRDVRGDAERGRNAERDRRRDDRAADRSGASRSSTRTSPPTTGSSRSSTAHRRRALHRRPRRGRRHADGAWQQQGDHAGQGPAHDEQPPGSLEPASRSAGGRSGDEGDDQCDPERGAELAHRLVDGRAEGVAAGGRPCTVALDSCGRVSATPSPVISDAGSIDEAHPDVGVDGAKDHRPPNE